MQHVSLSIQICISRSLKILSGAFEAEILPTLVPHAFYMSTAKSTCEFIALR